MYATEPPDVHRSGKNSGGARGTGATGHGEPTGSAPPGLVQVDDVDTVGRAYDKILEGAAPLGATLGKHTNDEMISYYVKTPSGWEMEYGYGGLEIDEETWVPGRWSAAHFWGHKRVG